MIAWDALTVALDELDVIRAQVREARAQERTARFYDLLRTRMIGSNRGEVCAKVIELSGGWVLCHWLHDQRAVSLYSSLLSFRLALCIDNEMLLSLVDASERAEPPNSHRSQTRSVLTPLEQRVLSEMGHGLSNSQIAQKMCQAPSTVKNRLTVIYRKLGVEDRTQAALLARDLGLTTVGT